MAKERAARYASWDEFSRDLAEIYGAVERRSEEISDTRKFQVLKGLSFFRGFGDAELWEFLRFSDWRRFTPGRVLLEEDRKGESFFVLGAGEARVSKGGRLLGIVHAGEPFGEMPYIFEESRARTATVTASNEVLLIKVRPEVLRAASEGLRLRINRAFLRVLAERLARADNLLASL